MVDINSDPGLFTLIRAHAEHPELFPSWMKETDLAELQQKAAEASGLEFADRGSNQYPISSKALVLASALYFSKEAGTKQLSCSEEAVWEEIKYAAELFGIEQDVSKIRAAYGQQKQASDDNLWAWNTGAEKKYPLHNAELTKTASTYFLQNRDSYPYAMRKEIATQIFKRAAALSIDIDDQVRKEAGIGYPDRTAIVDLLQRRSERVSALNPAAAEVLKQAADVVATADLTELIPCTTKIAELVDAYDHAQGFHYNKRKDNTNLVDRPCDAFFGVSEKQAEDGAFRFVALHSLVFDCEKIAQHFPLEEFETLFDDDFVTNRVKQLAEQGKLDGKSSATKVAFCILDSLSAEEKFLVEQRLKEI